MVFIFISNLLTSLFVFKRGFLGSLFIVFVKVIIWVNCRLFHCWAGGKHFFHLKELALLVVIKFWGVGGAFVFSCRFVVFPLIRSVSCSGHDFIVFLFDLCRGAKMGRLSWDRFVQSLTERKTARAK